METDYRPDTVEEILSRTGRGVEQTIPLLQAVQAAFGYVPREAMDHIVRETAIDATHIYGVATFYTQFRLSPVGRHIIRVCHGTACHVAGATGITAALREELGLDEETDTTSDRFATIEEVACLGCCSLAPVMTVDETTHGKLTAKSACKAVRDLREGDAGGEAAR